MRLSIYTIVRNGIFLDLHVEAMLRHHLPLADEIVVNEGFSTDDTYERISRIDPKIKIFREKWEAGHKAGMLYAECKNHARVRCTGDWCILMDCDEFIPEWEFDRIRQTLDTAQGSVVRLRFLQFYGNYRVRNAFPERRKWFVQKDSIHRNRTDMAVVYDGSNVVVSGNPGSEVDEQLTFEAHHMGNILNPARLRQKWRIEHQLKLDKPKWDKVPGFVYDLAPHDWFDADILDDLRVYEGPYVKAVRDNPAEFVRDDMKLYEYLRKKYPQEAQEVVEG